MEQYSEYSESKETNLQVDAFAQSLMLETGRWTKFLGIIGYILSSFLILGGLFALLLISSSSVVLSPLQNSIGAVGMFLLYTLGGLIYFYPSLLMHRYSINIKKAIANNDQSFFHKSLINLKRLFGFYGAILIVIIIIYVVTIIGIAVGTALV